ncbi:MAG: cytochrome C oxidase Cbb3 [Anaerolineaceae bacterium]|nr:cytochrome C oxidase Cbb3 [Anaerolineaceae bacterium]
MPTISIFVKRLLIATIISLVGAGLFIYSGVYPIGADVPHNKLTYWLLETLRERSIARAADNLQIPDDLDTSDRILTGGADYNDMCASCHLKPGKSESDFSIGLYPTPPNLTVAVSPYGSSKDRNDASIQRQYWIIKHGIKASGMPAWGPTHNDERIWNMVAFLQRLPGLTSDQYQILTARGDSVAEQQH